MCVHACAGTCAQTGILAINILILTTLILLKATAIVIKLYFANTIDTDVIKYNLY